MLKLSFQWDRYQARVGPGVRTLANSSFSAAEACLLGQPAAPIIREHDGIRFAINAEGTVLWWTRTCQSELRRRAVCSDGLASRLRPDWTGRLWAGVGCGSGREMRVIELPSWDCMAVTSWSPASPEELEVKLVPLAELGIQIDPLWANILALTGRAA